MKLSDIKKAADQKYAPFEVELESGRPVFLRVPLRLSREERQAISRAFDVSDEDDARDSMDIYEEVFRIVIEDEKDADELIENLDGDLAFYQELFSEFADQMQLGEASSSES